MLVKTGPDLGMAIHACEIQPRGVNKIDEPLHMSWVAFDDRTGLDAISYARSVDNDK